MVIRYFTDIVFPRIFCCWESKRAFRFSRFNFFCLYYCFFFCWCFV